MLVCFVKCLLKSFLKSGDPNIQPKLRNTILQYDILSLSLFFFFFLEESRLQNVLESKDGFLGGKELTHSIEGGRHLSGSNHTEPVPARRELLV